MLEHIPAQACDQIEDILEVCDLKPLYFCLWTIRGSKRLTPKRVCLEAMKYVCIKAHCSILKHQFACGYDGDKFVIKCLLPREGVEAILNTVPHALQNYAWDYLWETFVRGENHAN